MTPVTWTLSAIILYIATMAAVVAIAEGPGRPQLLARATVPFMLLLTLFAPITILVMLVIALVVYPRTTPDPTNH